MRYSRRTVKRTKTPFGNFALSNKLPDHIVNPKYSWWVSAAAPGQPRKVFSEAAAKRNEEMSGSYDWGKRNKPTGGDPM